MKDYQMVSHLPFPMYSPVIPVMKYRYGHHFDIARSPGSPPVQLSSTWPGCHKGWEAMVKDKILVHNSASNGNIDSVIFFGGIQVGDLHRRSRRSSHVCWESLHHLSWLHLGGSKSPDSWHSHLKGWRKSPFVVESPGGSSPVSNWESISISHGKSRF